MKIHPKITEFLATAFFISRIPGKLTPFKKNTGAGFVGTVIALLLAPFLPETRVYYAFFIICFFIFSMWTAGEASKNYGTHDDPRIVIDEILGYWTAIAFMERTPLNLLGAFVIFRTLDTLKPWPIKKLERTAGGGFGIIVDDAIAGIEANLLMRVLFLFIQ